MSTVFRLTEGEKCGRAGTGRGFQHSWLSWLMIGVFLSAAALAGYPQMFTTFVDYDDEGYVMMSLYHVVQGCPLYDETYTQYGPAFFQIHATLHQLLNLPVTHDVIRIKALIQWLAVCLLCTVTVFRMTRSLPLALSALVGVFCLLERFCVEPGHPQDIAALAVAGILFLSTWVRPIPMRCWPCWNHAILGFLGLLVGIVVMTKVNIGALLFLGVITSLLLVAEPGRIVSLFRSRILLIGAALPVLLIAKYWSIQQAVLLPMVTAASIGLSIVMIRKRAWPAAISGQGLMAFCLMLTLSVVSVLALTWINGTSVNGLVNGIVLQHLGFAGSFFSPPPVTTWIIPATIGSGVLAIFFLRERNWVVTLLRLGSITLLATLLVQFLLETSRPSAGGYEGRWHVQTLMSFAPLLCWILLFPGTGFRQSELRFDLGDYCFARVMLCFVSAFQLLICYPIPGSQIAMGTFPLIVVLAIASSDFLKTDLAHILPSMNLTRKTIAVAGFLLALASVTLLYRDIGTWRRHQAYQPLKLPGATLMRLPSHDVRNYRQLTAYLKQQADSFLFRESTQNCVYFWSEMKPPNAINATIWPYMLNATQQEAIVARLRETDRVVVVSTFGDELLPTNDAPLARYIEEHFEPADVVGGFDIWKRRTKQTVPSEQTSCLSRSGF